MGDLRILHIEGQTIFAEGLALILQAHHPTLSMHWVADMPAAYSAMDAAYHPDVIILGDGLDLENGVLAQWTSRYPHIPCLVLLGCEEADLIINLINDGALGYVPKQASSAQLLLAIAKVRAGEMCLPELQLQASKVVRDFAQLGLSPRQAEVLHYMQQGLANRDICARLKVSEATVKSHLSVIYRCLNVSTRTQAVIAAAALSKSKG